MVPEDNSLDETSDQRSVTNRWNVLRMTRVRVLFLTFRTREFGVPKDQSLSSRSRTHETPKTNDEKNIINYSRRKQLVDLKDNKDVKTAKLTIQQKRGHNKQQCLKTEWTFHSYLSPNVDILENGTVTPDTVLPRAGDSQHQSRPRGLCLLTPKLNVETMQNDNVTPVQCDNDT